jgi:hypothetical protein
MQNVNTVNGDVLHEYRIWLLGERSRSSSYLPRSPLFRGLFAAINSLIVIFKPRSYFHPLSLLQHRSILNAFSVDKLIMYSLYTA